MLLQPICSCGAVVTSFTRPIPCILQEVDLLALIFVRFNCDSTIFLLVEVFVPIYEYPRVVVVNVSLQPQLPAAVLDRGL